MPIPYSSFNLTSIILNNRCFLNDNFEVIYEKGILLSRFLGFLNSLILLASQTQVMVLLYIWCNVKKKLDNFSS